MCVSDLLEIASTERILTIKRDGTVVVHKEGASKEAAEEFYRHLQIEGQTLHQRIAHLEEQLSKYEEV